MQVCLIGCSKTKLKGEYKACELYQGDIFKKQLKLIPLKHPNAEILILSAKYGVVELTEEIQDYNITLNTMDTKQKKIWAYKVYHQLLTKGITLTDEIVFFCGENYNKYLKIT